MVLRREVRVEQANRGEGQRARGEGVEDDGKTPTGSRRGDPVAGGVLGQLEDLRAEGEECSVATAA
jgi:hypothetical protein